MKLTTIGENFSFLVLLSSFCFISTHARDAVDESSCVPDTEYWNSCGILPNCEKTCAQLDGRPCPKICSPGCFCNDGLVREYENSTVCLKKDKCPSIDVTTY